MNNGSLIHIDYFKLLKDNIIINKNYTSTQIQPSSLDLTLSDECYEINGAIWYGVPDSGDLGQCSDPVISRSASFTGHNCSNWKGHINGVNYAIQGNILLSEEILLGIEEGFLNTNGSLDQKLMAAMQGAKVPGADTRCLDEGISTLSAFIRVAKVDDGNDYYMDLNVNSVIPYYNDFIN